MFQVYFIYFVLLCFATVLVQSIPLLRIDEQIYSHKTNHVQHESRSKLYFLPETIKPIHYKLRMVPNLNGNFNFFGDVKIYFKVENKTKHVYLHSKNLKITSLSIFEKAKKPGNYKKVRSTFNLDPENDILNITKVHYKFKTEQHKVHIKFEGFLKDNMIGFYRSSYKTGNVTKWLATTQFEPTYARMAFPCFDEPRFKASFTISVARHPHQKAISNMPLKVTSEPKPKIDNRVWDTFKRTPSMPTYLVAFIVSDFNHTRNSTKNFEVWSREGAINDTEYILSEGPTLLQNMEEYLGVNYSLPKMDVVAIPDFQAGAMENWGLTTYRERYVTYNRKVAPTRSREAVITVVSHEFAHQWFGDLVTPTWWKYLWLNEGFATYFEYHLTNLVEPTWRMAERYVVDVVQFALSVDEVNSHHAMTSSWVQSPSDIESIFDAISYDKAGSVIRMFEHIVGSANFQSILNSYLLKGYQSGGLVTEKNLFQAFEDQMVNKSLKLPDGCTLRSIMKKWTRNRGYPLISVGRISNGNKVNITVNQTTYLSPRSEESTPSQSWIVPVTCTKQSFSNFSDTTPSFWCLPEKENVLHDEVDQNEWILCNVQQTGYYRVQYDQENWKLLMKQLHFNHTVIHPLNRAQIIDDLFSLAKDHKLDFVFALETLKYLSKETDPIPLYSALKHLEYLHKFYNPTFYGSILKRYILQIIIPLYNRFGFETNLKDDHSIKILRSVLIPFVCRLNHEDCRVAAKMEYVKNKSDLSGINPEIKSAVFCTVLNSEYRMEIWNNMWTLFKKSNVAWEIETVLLSFGCTESVTLLKQFMKKLINVNDTEIRSQYYSYVFRSVFSTSTGVTAMMNLIKDILQQYSDLQSSKIQIVHSIAQNVVKHAVTEGQRKKVDELISVIEKLNQTIYGPLTENLKNARQQTENQIVYYKQTLEKLGTALESITPTSTAEPITTASTTPVISTITSTTQLETSTTKPSLATNVTPSVIAFIFITLIPYISMIKAQCQSWLP